MDLEMCILCEKPLVAEDQKVKLFLFAQSMGMRPRLKSGAEAVCFCPTCAVSLAFGPEPTQGKLYLAAWRRLRELVGVNQGVTALAYEKLNATVAPPSRLLTRGDAEIVPFGGAARAS